MRLALVHPFLYVRGGAEKVVLKIAQKFNAKIYCMLYDKEKAFPEFKDLEIEVMPSRLFGMLPKFLPIRVRHAIAAGEVFYWKKLQDYEVINAHGTPSEWIRNKNERVLWYCHGPNREAFDLYNFRMGKRKLHGKAVYWSCIQAYKYFETRTIPKLEYVFANSKNTQNRLTRYLNLKSEILHPGVDYKDFECTGYEKYFFYPSRITPEKRFEYAIDAFKKFKAKNRMKGWKLIIAGALMQERAEHVSYFEWIRQRLGEDGEVYVNLQFPELKRLYSNAYTVLYSPIDEDFGIVPLEAMSSRKPCIAINEGGPKEVILEGKTGFLVNSIDEMAERMSFLAERPEEVERMGKKGRGHVEKHFSWDKFLKRFSEVCTQVGGKS